MTKSVKRTAFTLWLVLMLAIACTFTLFAAAEETDADPAPATPTVTYTTGKDMAANPDSIWGEVNTPAAKCPVANNMIQANAGYRLYYAEEVQAVDLDIQITNAADTDVFDIAFALRVPNEDASKAAKPNQSTVAGYWLRISKKGDGKDASLIQLSYSDGTQVPMENTAVPMVSYDWCNAPLFDGNIHNLKFTAVDKGDGKTEVEFVLDDKEMSSADVKKRLTAEFPTLPTENTGFFINNINKAATYNLFVDYQPPAVVNYTTSAMMAQEGNRDKVLKDWTTAHDGMTEESIPTVSGHLGYNAEVEGIESYIRFTTATSKQILLHLRAQGGGAPWNAGNNSYIAVLEAKKASLYRVDGAINPETQKPFSWDSKQIAKKDDFSYDIFDGDVYKIKFYAKENAKGNVELGFTIEDETVSGVDKETPLPIANTKFYTQAVAAGAAEFELLPTYTPPVTVQYVTADDMMFAKLLYNGSADTATQFKSLLDVVTVDGGKMVYKKAIDGADIELKVTSGDSLFFGLRATGDTPDSVGYFVKAEKVTEEETVQTKLSLYKNTVAGTQGAEIATATSDVNLFDGNKHRVKIQAFGAESVLITAELDPVTPAEGEVAPTPTLSYPDTDAPLAQKGTTFVITHDGETAPAFKLYGKEGVDITIPAKPYNVYTSKSLLKGMAIWERKGTAFQNGNIVCNGTEPKAFYSRAFENVMYNFDVQIGTGGWFAVCLNANKMDAIWNNGFRSLMARIQGSTLFIETWNPQAVHASVPLTGVDLTQKFNMECGLYNVTAENGRDYTFIRVAIDGKEIYNEPLPDNAYKAAGSLYFVAYDPMTFTIYPTETEIDKIPSGTNGVAESRENEDGLTETIKVTDWAPITQTFAPAYAYEGDEMILGGQGDASYKAAVDFTKLKFQFKLNADADAKGQFLEFYFGRKRQAQFRDQQGLARDATNYGYGVRLMPDGTVELMKTTTAASFTKPMTFAAGEDQGLLFSDGEYHTITIYREKLAGGGLKITVFVDDGEVGYSYTDADYYEANYPMAGYLSFYHSTTSTAAYVKGIVFEGEEIEPETALKAEPCNFVTFYPDKTEETAGTVYFVPQGANSRTKWVEVMGLDEGGEYTVLLGRAFYPSREVSIPKTYTGDKVLVVAVAFTAEGNWTRELELRDTEAEHTVPQDKVERIAIRESENGAYFVYAESGKEYLPVGGNYMSLRGSDHSTFDAATSFTTADYDPIKTDAMMREFSAAGGNMIRVFLIGRTSTNPGISGDSTIPVTNKEVYYEGLYIPYMENVAHFLSKAKQYGVYVMLTLGDADVPNNSYYLDLQGGSPLARNMMYLSTNGVKARSAYAANVTKYFVEKHPDLVPAIFSVAFQNEFAMYGNQAPFGDANGNLGGTFTGANGKTYDMTDAAQRQACHDEGAIYYLNAMTKAVKDVDPNMLVNEGSFTLHAVYNGDEVGCPAQPVGGDSRYPAHFDIYLSSNIDFLDVHIYFRGRNNATIRGSFASDLETMRFYEDETQELLKRKPLFMGEFGADTGNTPNWNEPNGDLPSAHDALLETVRLANEAGFRGFAQWTMESHLQTTWWNTLSYDGTFAFLKEMIAEMHGAIEAIDASAANVTGTAGENNSITVTGTVEGDKVYYRTSEEAEWSETNPVFTEAGTYTVYYKVTRAGADDFTGSATVTVEAAAPSVDPIAASAANVTGKAGENNSITVTGTAEGDKVYYRTSEEADWSETNPVFTEAGTYTVYYKVTRTGTADFTGSATVTVTAEEKPPVENTDDSGCGCGGSVGAVSASLAVLALGAAALLTVRKKKQNS